MNARSFLLPLALFALAFAGCDAVSTPEAGALQAGPAAPTANLSPGIEGPDNLAYSCPTTYSIDRTDGYFTILSGPGTVSSTYYGIFSHSYAEVTRGPSTAPIVLAYQSYGDGDRVSKTIGFVVGCES